MKSEEATVLNLDITGSCLKGLSTFCLLTNASASRNRQRGSKQFETCVGKCQRQSKYCEVEIFLKKKKDIYNLYILTSQMLNASRSPVVQFDQNLHCNSSSVNLTCSHLNHENTIDKN